eukprot:5105050-Prymnesium_polylepis.2
MAPCATSAVAAERSQMTSTGLPPCARGGSSCADTCAGGHSSGTCTYVPARAQCTVCSVPLPVLGTRQRNAISASLIATLARSAEAYPPSPSRSPKSSRSCGSGPFSVFQPAGATPAVAQPAAWAALSADLSAPVWLPAMSNRSLTLGGDGAGSNGCRVGCATGNGGGGGPVAATRGVSWTAAAPEASWARSAATTTGTTSRSTMSVRPPPLALPPPAQLTPLAVMARMTRRPTRVCSTVQPPYARSTAYPTAPVRWMPAEQWSRTDPPPHRARLTAAVARPISLTAPAVWR